MLAVLTTVQAPTRAARSLAGRVAEKAKGRLIVAGDRKGPAAYDLPDATFLSLTAQMSGPFELGRRLPTGHYCRKNIAYLEAVRQGAACIYESDDDNAPLPCWRPREEFLAAVRVVARPNGEGLAGVSRWVNVYRYFTEQLIWPRGLPLDEIRTPVPATIDHGWTDPDITRRPHAAAAGSAAAPRPRPGDPSHGVVWRAPIQQGLVNGAPDVDAIWRLTLDRPFEFDGGQSVCLEPGNWCPFNTQSTWWWPVAYPLLYVPSHCSFRMCDIWKSFVAQRCLWELGLGVVFHAPEVVQERNPHNLMRDFSDEIPGYQRNRELAQVLAGTPLEPGEGAVASNLRHCYEALVAAGLLPVAELDLVGTWLADLGRLGVGAAHP